MPAPASPPSTSFVPVTTSARSAYSGSAARAGRSVRACVRAGGRACGHVIFWGKVSGRWPQPGVAATQACELAREQAIPPASTMAASTPC
jgi:hypothetical protein